MMKHLLAGAAFSLLWQAGVHPAPLASVEMSQVSSGTDTAFIVTVDVGSMRGRRFLLDTAATRTAITPNLRNLLGLHVTDATTEVVTGAGGLIGAQSFILPAVGVDRAVEQDLHVLVLDLPKDKTWIGVDLDGILGMDFLRNYDVRLSRRTGTMQLNRTTSHVPVPSDDLATFAAIGFDMGSPGLVLTSVKLNDQPVIGVLDTGASRSVLNRRAAALAGISAAGDSVDTIGADGQPVRIGRQRLKRLEFAGVVYEDELVSVGDLPIFEHFDLNAVPAVILGAGSLKDREVLISNSKHMLYLSPREQPAPDARAAAAPVPPAAG